MRRAPQSGLCLAAVCAASLTACSRSPVTHAAGTGPAPSTSHPTLALAYETPPVVGATAHATAAGLPPGKTVDLTWGTVTGGWVVEDYYHFRGKKYAETTKSLGQFPVDASR